MQKILSVLIAVAFMAILTPGVNAETVTSDYNGAIGFNAANAAGYAVVVCPASCDFNEVCVDDQTCTPDTGLIPVINPVGGARLYASTIYTNVVVSLSDDLYGAGAAISACFWNPEGDNTCDGDDYGSDWVCGTVPLLGSPFPGDFVTVWALTILVSEDLDTCGATAGTITGDFF